MKNKIGFPKLCANETLLNEYYKHVSPVIDFNVISFFACARGCASSCVSSIFLSSPSSSSSSSSSSSFPSSSLSFSELLSPYFHFRAIVPSYPLCVTF